MNSSARNPEQRDRANQPGSKFLRMTGGVSLIRYWGVSDGFASSPQAFVRVPAAADEPMTRGRDAESNQPSRKSVEPAPASRA
jgi:hypothetical protein